MVKRALAFAVAILMILSLQTEILADNVLDEALFDVSALELMIPDENGSFATERVLTRAEFATAVLRLIGYNENYENMYENIFTDVNKDDWFCGSVARIYALGIMSGDGNGCFRPNDAVTMPEAAKTFVSVLGYDTDALNKGGYPSGYIASASKLGVLDNVGVNGALTRRELAIMLYNVLDIELLEPAYGTNELYKNGETLRYSLMRKRGEKIYNLMGIVQANSFSYTKFPVSDLEKDEVVINGVRYKKGNSDADRYLGMEVEIFAVENQNGRLEILTVRPTINNNITVVNNSDIMGSTQDYVIYDADNKNEKLSYEEFPCMLYNGTPVSFDKEELLNLAGGEVKFIDCNGNDLIDYIFIEEAENILVDRVTGSVIVAQGGFTAGGRNTLYIDFENKEKQYEFLTSSGKTVGFDAVKPNQFISVCTDRNETRYRIYISDSYEEGILESFGENEVTVNGKTFTTSSNTIFDASLGNNAAVYLDYLGNAAYIKLLPEEKNYAYVLGTGTKGLSKAQIKLVLSAKVSFTADINEEDADNITSTPVLLCHNREVAVYDVADKVKINGKSYSALDAMEKMTEGTIIMYSLNSEGLFREAEILDAYANETGRTLSYDVREKVFGGNQFVSGFGLDEATQIIAVPESPDCDEDYLVLSRVDEAGSAEHGYAAKGYDKVEQTKKAGLAVIKMAMDSDSVQRANLKSSAACMVKSIKTIVSGDKEFYRITLNEKGTEKTYDTVELSSGNSVIATLREGDLISYFMNDEDLIENVFLIRSFKTDSGSYNIDEADRDVDNAYKERRGSVVSVEFNEISKTMTKVVTVANCEITGAVNPIEIGQRNAPPVYIYEPSAEESVRTGSLEEIIPGNDELYILTIGTELPRVCVIIR